ncbi:MAG TPA: alpha-L-arabinofuranosidase C-terminal domain-containing protein, partial [Bryobacteraceae bacterium]|nr:alpha-L-arabinofuranosidase C-terminal domain-containing protein [Bryobacteraceae bacterium]
WDRMVPAEEKQYGALLQQITMRSAVAAALGLNVFHRQAEKLVMCNIAQIVNVLHSLILTDGPRACRTTTYWAFDMLKAHRGRTSVRVSNPDPAALALSVSASKQGNELVLTFVNPKPSQALDVSCAISGANPASATATLLNHASLNAANTFDQPDLIMPKPIAVQAAAGKLTMNLPALSIATVRVKLA